MSQSDRAYRMWVEACELLSRADGLQRQFFQPAHGASWEPPVDVFETDSALWILVALPGVRADQIELLIDGGDLVVTGARQLPRELRQAALHRLEIPSGRFQRRIPLPRGRYELVERRFTDGCLTLGLRRSSGAADWS
jgi:HSP20 family protein